MIALRVLEGLGREGVSEGYWSKKANYDRSVDARIRISAHILQSGLDSSRLANVALQAAALLARKLGAIATAERLQRSY
jgi:hypothetical protein